MTSWKLGEIMLESSTPIADVGRALWAPLLRPGRVGFDVSILEALLSVPAVGEIHTFEADLSVLPAPVQRAVAAADRVLITIGCIPEMGLHDLNAVVELVANAVSPNAELFVGAPEDEVFFVCLLTLRLPR